MYNFQNLLKNIFFEEKKKLFLTISKKNYTYYEVDKLSEIIANYLFSKKIKKGNIIAIEAEKDILVFSAIFACLKLGCPYVLIDQNAPEERIKKILYKCNPNIFLYFNIDSLNKIKFSRKILLKKILKSKHLDKRKEILINDDIPAYIMFTSGSTGFPKGAIIKRGGLIDFARCAKKKFFLKKNDKLTNVNPLYFDNSVFDIYASFINRLSMAVFLEREVRDPFKLIQLLKKYKCTTWFSTPSLLIYLQNMKLINKKNFKLINKIIFGGEGYPIPKLKELTEKLGKKIYINVYGPTEGTCICSSHVIRKSDLLNNKSGYITIGNIWNIFRYKILKSGELVIFGKNIANGYVGDKNQTEKNFIFKNKKVTGYRTGDFFYFKNKKIYFKGRKDNQVKIMGHRIELMEIEIAINKIKNVKEAAVFCAHKEDNKKIVSVLATNNRFKKEFIYKKLKNLLPSYMIPSNIYILNSLDKNSNGKIDRTKLRKIYGQKSFI